MLPIATLRQPRALVLAAALILAAALPGAGLASAAHAAPAIPLTTLSASFTGPANVLSSGDGSIPYTVALRNSPYGNTALNTRVFFEMPQAEGTIASYAASNAICNLITLGPNVAVICNAGTLLPGAVVALTVAVQYTAPAASNSVRGGGLASNASLVAEIAQSSGGGHF
jgi:hypothetical protein